MFGSCVGCVFLLGGGASLAAFCGHLWLFGALPLWFRCGCVVRSCGGGLRSLLGCGRGEKRLPDGLLAVCAGLRESRWRPVGLAVASVRRACGVRGVCTVVRVRAVPVFDVRDWRGLCAVRGGWDGVRVEVAHTRDAICCTVNGVGGTMGLCRGGGQCVGPSRISTSAVEAGGLFCSCVSKNPMPLSVALAVAIDSCGSVLYWT